STCTSAVCGRRSTAASTGSCCIRSVASAIVSTPSRPGTMRLRRLFHTSVFRLTLAYAALFAISVGALSAIVYWSTLGYLERQNNAVIEAEINGLSEQYERSGLTGLADIINERVERDAERRSVYLLADAIRRRLA